MPMPSHEAQPKSLPNHALESCWAALWLELWRFVSCIVESRRVVCPRLQTKPQPFWLKTFLLVYCVCNTPAMSSASGNSSGTASGYEPQSKRQKTWRAAADRADELIIANQPGRVRLEHISWYHDNRGTQGALPIHAHDIAQDISKNGVMG